MENPQIVACPKGEWTPVALNTRGGVIHRLKSISHYFWTYRIAGETAPTDLSEGKNLFDKDDQEKILETDGIDYYVYCKIRDGSIRFDSYPTTKDVRDEYFDTPPIDLFFIELLDIDSLAAVTAINDRTITLDDATGFVAGDYIGIFSGVTGEGRFYFGEQIGAPAGDVITLDTPLDFAFGIGDPVIRASRELNVLGTFGSPRIFVVQGAGVGSPLTVDITRLIIQMTTLTAPEFGDFGDISGGLTNGVVLRRNNGIVNNIYNVKTNGEISNLMYDFTTFDPANPAGVNGIAGRNSFAGRSKHGTAIRLKPGDILELWIQDDLTGLLTFRIAAQGRIRE